MANFNIDVKNIDGFNGNDEPTLTVKTDSVMFTKDAKLRKSTTASGSLGGLPILGSLNGMVVGYDGDTTGEAADFIFLIRSDAPDKSGTKVTFTHNIFTRTLIDPMDYYRQLTVLLNVENISNFGRLDVDDSMKEVETQFSPKKPVAGIPPNSMLAVLMRLTHAKIGVGDGSSTVVLGDDVGSQFKSILEYMYSEKLSSGAGNPLADYEDIIDSVLNIDLPHIKDDADLAAVRSVIVSGVLETSGTVSNLFYNPTIPNTIFDIADTQDTKESLIKTVLATDRLDSSTKILSHILTGSDVDADIATQDNVQRISNKIIQARQFVSNLNVGVSPRRLLSTTVLSGEFNKYFSVFKKIINMAKV
jgi:hypothetical protein